MPSRHTPSTTTDRDQDYRPGAALRTTDAGRVLSPTPGNLNRTGPRICGTILVDLADPSTVERNIQWAAHSPAGTDVVLVVKPRQQAPWAALAYLIEHGQHLASVTVQSSDPATIADWVRELRAEVAL
jgi:hypothetical protein